MALRNVRQTLGRIRWSSTKALSRPPVELRSDTFTKPSEGMRRAMYEAEVGDDCYKEDVTVQKLEQTVADMCGKEEGMFVASGTMGNLLALAAHCRRGDEIILGNKNHIFTYEGGGASALLGVAFHTIPTKRNGTYELQDVEDAIRPDDFYFPKTRLIAVENTHNSCGGKALPLKFLSEIADVCKKNNLIFHMDGARLMNAAVVQKTKPSVICKDTDSISICLSKGLGAPVGSVVVGNKDFIKEAKRQRKILGGGWRQAGVIAAGGQYAIEHNIQRLEDDHIHAKILAAGLSEIAGVEVDMDVETNMVFFDVKGMSRDELTQGLRDEFNVFVASPYKGRLRAVTSLMVTREDIEYTINAVRHIMKRAKASTTTTTATTPTTIYTTYVVPGSSRKPKVFTHYR